jgi:molecular chaperone GrpE
VSEEPEVEEGREANADRQTSAEEDGAVTTEVDDLGAAREEAAKYRDQLLRTAADFDNFRKRSRREVQEAMQRGGDDLLRELLPVFDNLERATAHADAAADVQALVSGIGMVMKQFQDALARAGIERVISVGESFDPAVHEAIQHLETADHPAGTVAQEVQGGYKSGERLIRPAMVVVSKGNPTASEADASAADAELGDPA